MERVLNIDCTAIEEARKTNRGNRLLLELPKSALVFFVMICISGILSDLSQMVVLGDKLQDEYADVFSLYGQILSIGITIFYCTVLERRSIQSMGFRRNAGKLYCTGVLLGAVVFSLAVLVCVIGGGVYFDRVSPNANVLLQLLLLGGFVVQGMSEEVICRGYLLVSLSRKNSVWVACLVNSLLFGAVHIFNDGFSLLAFLNLSLFGIFESLLFLKTGSIWIVGAVHSIWNYMEGCVYGLSVSGESMLNTFLVFEQTDKKTMNGGAFGIEGGIAVTIVLLAAIVFLLFTMFYRRKNKTAFT